MVSLETDRHGVVRFAKNVIVDKLLKVASAHGFDLNAIAREFDGDDEALAQFHQLIGYSVSDTIVVFDRIREVRGKNPVLTPQMINDSVNQTLSRTLLASLTVFLVAPSTPP